MIAAWALSENALYPWVILPMLIFMARVADVTLGTIRLVFVTRGYKYLAPLIGFAEILIWILVMGQIMGHLSNVACYVAYSGGFATGNFVGMWLAEKLIKGNVMIRVVTQRQADHLIEALRKDDYGVTSVDGQGVQGAVKVIFTIIPRNKTSHVIKIIRQFNPKAFYTVEEVGQVGEGVFPARIPHTSGSLIRLWRPFRKGK
ncbi:MAG: DUF2179 domain-containing protein [Phycisphaeraceae bacterium]|nr:DUF2179 domain-containing protein [Phycisphaeraceae bacterium]